VKSSKYRRLTVAVNTTTEVVYNPDFTYQLTAGIGTFQGAYVAPYIQNLATEGFPLPYGLLASAYDFVTNPESSVPISPMGCSGANCTAYILPGGLGATTPWPPQGYPESEVVAIWNAPAMQIEFLHSMDAADVLVQSDCDVIGSQEWMVAVQFCLATSQKHPGSYISRKFLSRFIKISG
jgi:hypothetical protein